MSAWAESWVLDVGEREVSKGEGEGRRQREKTKRTGRERGGWEFKWWHDMRYTQTSLSLLPHKVVRPFAQELSKRAFNMTQNPMHIQTLSLFLSVMRGLAS